MNVEIHFRPDDGPPQTLYASMSREDFDYFVAETKASDAEEAFLTIKSRTKKTGPSYDWLFRASRVELKEEGTTP